MRHAIRRAAWADLRQRPLQSVLVGVIVVAATTTLMLALNVRRSLDEPFERTFAATNGAHVHAFSERASTDLGPLTRLPGVAAHEGPVPIVFRRVVLGPHRAPLSLQSAGRER